MDTHTDKNNATVTTRIIQRNKQVPDPTRTSTREDGLYIFHRHQTGQEIKIRILQKQPHTKDYHQRKVYMYTMHASKGHVY
jgi:hypothetical protein